VNFTVEQYDFSLICLLFNPVICVIISEMDNANGAVAGNENGSSGHSDEVDHAANVEQSAASESR